MLANTLFSRTTRSISSVALRGSLLHIKPNVSGYTPSVRTLCPTNVSSTVHFQQTRHITSVYSRKLQDKVDHSLPEPQNPEEGFAKLHILPELTQLLVSHGITQPTPIQNLAIPSLLTGVDAAIGAQTGTGKTLTFVLPIIQRLILGERHGEVSQPNRPRGIIIAPSRELVLQIAAVAKSLCHHPDARLRVASVVGGENINTSKDILLGENNYKSIRARNMLTKLEYDKLREYIVLFRDILRVNYQMEKKQAQRLANVVVWKTYLSNLPKEYRDNILPDNFASLNTGSELRDIGKEVLQYVSNGKIQYHFETNAESIIYGLQYLLKDGIISTIDDVESMNKTIECIQLEKQAKDYVADTYDDVHEAEHGIPNEPYTNVREEDITNHDYEDDYEYDTDAEYNTNSTSNSKRSSNNDIESIREDAILTLNRNRNVDLLIATPGRLVQLMKQNLVYLSDTSIIAFDEADFMFHPKAGYVEELGKILAPVRKRLHNEYYIKHKQWPSSMNVEHPQPPVTKIHPVQLMYAGATLGGNFIKILKEILPIYNETLYPRELRTLETHNNLCLPKLLKQTWIRIGSKDKLQVLTEILSANIFKVTPTTIHDPNHTYPSSVLIFCNSISSCRAVQHALHEANVSVVGSHGEIPPKLRKQYWTDFLSKKAAVMVSTDVASRGIDTRFISQVINFDFPLSPVDYLHRAGRTARAQEAGHVINLLMKGDEVLAKAIDNAHQKNLPITALSSDKEAYRTDIAKELRKDAALLGVSKKQILLKKAELREEERQKQREVYGKRLESKRDEKLKHELSQMPWQRRSGTSMRGAKHTRGDDGVVKRDDYNADSKKAQMKRVVRDVKQEYKGQKYEKVDKMSDVRYKEEQELAKKGRFARAKGVDEAVTSKTKSVNTMMSDKAIREKIEYTLKTMRTKAYKKKQAEEAMPNWKKGKFDYIDRTNEM